MHFVSWKYHVSLKCFVLEITTFRGNAMCGKKYFHEGIQPVTHEICRGDMREHMCKNEVANEQYCR